MPFGKTRKFAQTAFNINELGKQTFITKISALREKNYANSRTEYETIDVNFTQ